MRCERARPALLALLDAEPAQLNASTASAGSAAAAVARTAAPQVDPAANDHIAQCLRCQAELAQHRRIRRDMVRLRRVTVEPGPTMLDSILAGLAEQAVSGVSGPGRSATLRRRALAVGVGAAAASAGVAGAVVVMSRVGRARRAAPGSHVRRCAV